MMEEEVLTLSNDFVQRFATSQQELASFCDCSVSTIARALQRHEGPGKTINGRYEIDAWRNWLATRGEVANEQDIGNGDLKRRRLAAAVLREEASASLKSLEVKTRNGELVEAKDVIYKTKLAVNKLFYVLKTNLAAFSTDEQQYKDLVELVRRSFNETGNLFRPITRGTK